MGEVMKGTAEENEFSTFFRSRERFKGFRTCREQAGLSREALAYLSKLSDKTIQRIEMGVPVTADSIDRYISAFDETMQPVLKFIADPGEEFLAAYERLSELEKTEHFVSADRIKTKGDLVRFFQGALVLKPVWAFLKKPSDEVLEIIDDSHASFSEAMDIVSILDLGELKEFFAPMAETIKLLEGMNIFVHGVQPVYESNKFGTITAHMIYYSDSPLEKVQAMVSKETEFGSLKI